ncbi:MAG: DUF1850 domain-containing protein [Pelagibacteraceae bacterium]
MSLCILSGAKLTTVAISLFTLSWTHSVEKTEWQENWRINNSNLEIVEARIKGSGAGMDPPENAVLKNGWYVYKPQIGQIKELNLSTSNTDLVNWKICFSGNCTVLENNNQKPIKIYACE